MILKLCAVLIFLFHPTFSYAELYQYIDKNGSIALTDNIKNIPPGQRPKVKIIKKLPKLKIEPDSLITKGIQKQTEEKTKKVIITEYSSFSCGWCNRVRSTLRQIKEKYPKVVKMVYKHFDRGGIDSKAGQAAECASDQGKFWEMHDLLFDRVANGNLTKYARDIGLNINSFNKCLDSEKYASKIQEDTFEGMSLGITGTPGFIINGILVRGAQPFSVFDNIIKAELNN